MCRKLELISITKVLSFSLSIFRSFKASTPSGCSCWWLMVMTVTWSSHAYLLLPSQSCHVFPPTLWCYSTSNDHARYNKGHWWVGGSDGGLRLHPQVGTSVWEQRKDDGMLQPTPTLSSIPSFYLYFIYFLIFKDMGVSVSTQRSSEISMSLHF